VRVAAVVFDLYGTLLRFEAMREPLAAAGVPDPEVFIAAWRRKQLEYSFLTSLAGAYRDFDELTALALDHTCAQLRWDGSRDARAALAAAWRTLPVYEDVAPALDALARRAIPLAVLTNGRADSARAALAAAGIANRFADVLSVDTVRAYKPDPRAYALATARFSCAPDKIVFVSSNAWDAWGAQRFGLRVAWCNRAGAAPETLTPAPERSLSGLAELDALVAAEL